jgi:hypothetical protein
MTNDLFDDKLTNFALFMALHNLHFLFLKQDFVDSYPALEVPKSLLLSIPVLLKSSPDRQSSSLLRIL